MKKQYKNICSIYLFIFLILSQYSCKKFLEVDPPIDRLVSETIFENDATAEAAVNGLYYSLLYTGFASGNEVSVTMLFGLEADELTTTDNSYQPFFLNNIPSDLSYINYDWSHIYNIIYQANSILEGLEISSGVSEAKRLRLRGETLFIRAFCYFYLTNTWGDAPLILSSDYKANSSVRREDQQTIYEQIIEDLSQARDLLPADYAYNNGSPTKVNKFCAAAMLARVYLYQNKWDKAEQYSTEVLNSGLYMLKSDLDSVFLLNSKEEIWQLYNANPVSDNTNEGATFNFGPFAPPSYSLRSEVLSAFESNDNRKMKWLDIRTVSGTEYIQPYKYRIKSRNFYTYNFIEASSVLRLAEQYLIRAEARANLGNISGAQLDLNAIRNRAGLPNTTASSQSALLPAIMQEKRIELFSEWGHRWFDLKRWNKSTEVLGPLKGADWQETDLLWPIPSAERIKNPNLTQNAGY